MLNFLVDVNLPKHFKYFNTPNFIHVVDLNPSMDDKQIWEYAIKNNYIILTKDSDFYHRFITTNISPKIVHFKLGNQTLNELHVYFQQNWNTIVGMLENSRFILATKSEIKSIH